MLGAGGPPEDEGFSLRYIVADRLGNNILPYLVMVPLLTATIGWAADDATARIRPRLAAGPNAAMTVPDAAGPAVRVQSRPRTERVVIPCALGALVVLLSLAGSLRG